MPHLDTERESGIRPVGKISWGTHFCQLYESVQDLTDIVIPYIKAGLQNNESCAWIVSGGLDIEKARQELKKAVPDIDELVRKGQLEITSYEDWYFSDGILSEPSELISQYVEKAAKAVNEGFEGMRISCSLSWLDRLHWGKYLDFEKEINTIITNHRMLLQCSYSLETCVAAELLDVIKYHRIVLVKRDGAWDAATSPELMKQEKGIEESETRYRTLFENTLNPILVIDTEGNYIDGNSAALRFLECSKEELVSMNVKDTIPPGIDEEKTMNLHENLWEKGGTIETGYQVGEKTKILELTVTPGRWRGSPVIFGIGTDRTEQKEIAARLKESEDMFSVAFHSSPDIIALTTLKDGRYIDINDNYTRFTGYTRSELIGKRTIDMGIWVNEADRDHMVRMLKENGKVFGEEYDFRIKSGEIRNWRFSAERIMLSGEDCLVFTAVDITEQRKTQRLQDNENRILRLLEQDIELGDILRAITLMGEEFSPGTKASVMLYDPISRLLKLAAAPGFSEAYLTMLEDGLAVGPNMGTCGTAAYSKERVVVPDISSSSLFPNSKPLITMGLHSGISYPILSSTGDLLGTIAYYFDKAGEPNHDSLKVLEWSAGIAAITIEHKRAGEALKESEDRFRTMVNSMEEIIFTLDTEMRHTGVYGLWVEKFGYTPEYFLGKTARDIFGPEGAWTHEEANRKALSGEFVIYEWQAAQDSGISHFQTSLSPIRDVDNTVIGIVGIGRDITEYKKAEQELSLRALLLDSASDAICLLDRTGQFVYVNDMYCQLHRYSREELLGMNIMDLDTPPNEDLFTWLDNELDSKGYAVFDSTHVRKDGSIINLEVYSRVIESGGQHFNLSLERDITERKRVEAALRESEEFSTGLLNNSPNPIIVINPDTSIRYVNPALERNTGYSSEELIGKKAPYPYWGPQAGLVEMERLKQHTSQGVEGFETQLTRKNGEIFWVKVNNTPVMIDGELEYAIASWVDITETKLAEEALKESETRYRALFQNAPVGITISTENGDIIEANKALLQIHGYDSLEEFKRVPVSKRYLNVEDRARWQEYMNNEGKIKDYEVQCLRKDGSVFWAALNSISQTQVSTGKINIVAVQDITERKNAADVLRGSEEKYRSLVNNISLGIFRSTSETHGRFLEVNRAMEVITGYSREELLKLDINDLYRYPEERESVLKELMSLRRALTKELRFRKKDGTEILVMDTKVPVRDDSGQVKYFDGILEDITLRKSLEEERQKVAKLESLGILAGGLAHDFNNMLTGIMGNISLAMMSIDEDNEAYLCLQDADKASERARDLTHQLLTFSRGGAPIKKPTDLSGLIKENTEFIMRGSGIKTEYSISDDLWMVEADHGQISQVLTNIIINAREAMPDGGAIRIRATNTLITNDSTLLLEPGEYIELKIADTGAGISPGYVHKIFDPYFTTKQRGSGIGLATAYSIVKNHNGLITVESELGKGTTFYIYLPAIEKTVDTEKEKPKDRPGTGKGGKILVMDDEGSIRMLLNRMLSGLGYEVETASEGEEAIQVYARAIEEQKPFDIVILDITVPGGMGGIATIKKLLDIDPKVKAVVSSGYATDPVMSEYKEYGFKAVVNKPYKVSEMKETLLGLLSDK